MTAYVGAVIGWREEDTVKARQSQDRIYMYTVKVLSRGVK